MANELNADMLKVALKSIDDFAARELPDSLLIELDERDEFPEELVRRMSSGDELGHPACVRARSSTAAWAAGRSTSTASASGWRRSTSGSRPPSSRRSSAATRSASAAREEQKREYMTRIAKEGVLFAYGATEPEAGSDLGALKTIAEPVGDNGNVTGYRISGAKQWISNGGVADLYTILALAPGRAELVRRRRRRRRLHARRARGQARDPAEQHRGAVPRQGLRRRRPADRRRRGPGPRPGPAGVRLHAADGGGVRPGRRLGGARPRDRLLAASASRRAARCPRSRATRTS